MVQHADIDHTGITGVGSGGGGVGLTPFAAQVGLDNTTASFAVTRTLAAVAAGLGGAAAALVFVPTSMQLRSISVWNKNTGTARTAEGRIYAVGSSATAAFVTGSNASWSFTPSAASLRAATVSAAPLTLPAGYYLVVIRNTSATQTFDIGAETQGSANLLKGGSVASVAASVAALGTTIDVTGWPTRAGSIIGIQLDGEIFGTGAAWDV